MGEKNIRSLFAEDSSGNFHEIMNSDGFPNICVGYTRSLTKYGIYITNNGLKMHGKPMVRKSTRRKQKYVTGLFRLRH